MSGADRGKACVPVADMASGSVLCMCSAMSGIDALMTLLSGGDAEARGPLGELSGTDMWNGAICPHACYGMPGTNPAYCRLLRACYAMLDTSLAYTISRCPMIS
eukprot:3053795-Rhodomonas_salina.1